MDRNHQRVPYLINVVNLILRKVMYNRYLETDADAKAAHDRDQKAAAAARLKAVAAKKKGRK